MSTTNASELWEAEAEKPSDIREFRGFAAGLDQGLRVLAPFLGLINLIELGRGKSLVGIEPSFR